MKRICRVCKIDLFENNIAKNGNICKPCYNKQTYERKRLKKEGVWENSFEAKQKKHLKMENGIPYKLCTGCQEWKTYENYIPSKQEKTGFRAKCKICTQKHLDAYRKKCKESPPKRATPHKNIDDQLYKICNMCNVYKTLDCFSKSSRTWDGLYPSCKICRGKKRNERFQERYHNDPEYRKKRIDESKKQMKEKTEYKLRSRLRCRIWNALKGIYKSASTIELLGCSIIEFLQHIEKQFQPGMTIQNYGEWHIDHIIPCANFNLSDPEEQKKCFHYKNLQPLWAKDNMSKGARLDWCKV